MADKKGQTNSDQDAKAPEEVIPAPGEEPTAAENGAPTEGNSALAEAKSEEAESSGVPEAAKNDSGPKAEEEEAAESNDEQASDAEGQEGDKSEQDQDEGAKDEKDDEPSEEGEEEKQPVMTIYDMNATPSEHGKDFFPPDSVEAEKQKEEEDTRTREDDNQVLAGQESDDAGLPIDVGTAIIESGLDVGEPGDEYAEEISDLKLSHEEGAREDAKALSPDRNNANTGPGTGDVTVSTMDNGENGGKRIQDPEGTGKEQVLMSDTPEHRVANVPMGVEPFSDYVPTPHKVQSNRPSDRPEPNRREHEHDFPGNRAQKGREENKEKKNKDK